MLLWATQFQLLRTLAQGLLLTLVMVVPCATSASAQGAGEHKRVLVVLNNDSFTATQTTIERALRETLRDGSPVPVETYSEYVGNTRAGTDYEKEFVALLRRKYEGKKFDVIFSIGQFPTSIILRNRDELFPGTPIVFLSVDQRNVAGLYPAPDLTGVWGELNFKSNLELALALHPRTRRVVVIQGVSETDKFWAAQAHEDFREFESRLEFSDLSGLTVPEMRNALASLPPETVVFFVSCIRDKAGNTYESPDYLRQVSPASTAPIYGTTEGHLGNGIVGGRLHSFNALGVEGGRIGLRLLAGEKPEAIAPYAVPSVPMFDGRELRRWKISEQALPPGSVVRFKEPSLWELYKWYIIGGISLVILQTLFIVYLLINRARRMRAEKERERFAQLAAAEHKHLDEIVSNVPGIVWESLYDPDTNTYKLTFISDYAEKMLGYTTEEWLSAESDLGRSFMLGEEDRDRVALNSEAVVKTGKEDMTQFRWRAKDGRILRAESSLNPIVDETGKIIGLRGVTVDVTEKYLAEEAKRESEERNRAILHAIPDLMFLQTRDGVYLDYHAQDPRELFVPPEEYLGKNMRDILPPELVESHLVCFREAEKTGEPQTLEYKLKVGGDERWFEARIVFSDGKILSIVRDVTQRKQTENEITFQAHLLNTIEESVIATDMSGTVIFWNHFAEKLYGWSPEEAVGRPSKDLLRGEDSQGQAEEIWSQLRKGQAWAGEFTVKNRYGDTLQIWANDSPIFDERGNVIGVIGISYDISERKNAERALRESEARLRMAQQAARVGTWEWDVQTGASVWSEMIWELVGLVPDDVPTTVERFAEFIHPEDRDQVLRKVNEVLAEGEEYYDEFRLVRRDGRVLWVSSKGRVTRSASGQPERMLGVNIDINERKQAEEALKRALDEVRQLKDRLQEENIYLREEIRLEHNFSEIVGHSDAIKYVLHKIEQVAPTDSTVLIMGETGTGKELIARAIHGASLRMNRPLVKVNCAALSAGLIESELFGHEKGAFTGAATRKIGRFELANGATIFLDEVGELPPELQVKLLRVIQEGEFERLGGNRTIKVDVRIIAATNRNLWEEVQQGRFREDLWYRLNVFPLTTPPLRQRKEDIPLLVEHFVGRFSKKVGKEITSVAPATLDALINYSWPGNVRELANIMERAVINNSGSVLHLGYSLDALQVEALSAAKKTLEEIEREYIISILDETSWRIEGPQGAAMILGLHPSTLRTRMAKLKIEKPKHTVV